MKAIEKAMEMASLRGNRVLEESIRTVCCPKDFDIVVKTPKECQGICTLKKYCNSCWNTEIC
ncbi:hypothetical protein [Clostridium sp.]|uniref:hypothetical protein n=1 Tax=Clostridium sp. TaxID=1506 RepID=UPI001B4DA62A|nr:hypothetical protein [Clostridium sp.]MBP3915036.1 hypothetical protein [Clostridium sp.]